MALKGRTPTKAEKKLMEQVADQGCIVCRNQGMPFVPAEIHHIYGKTKVGSHTKILPLCFAHHREGNGEEPISRHPYKKRFVEAYGAEEDLWLQVMAYCKEDEF
tara:strand:- start:808 stop:1119 length:312 start_codon:yes stop_codon:yes gene_type:complete